MTTSFQNKTVIVAGGFSGIGLATVIHLLDLCEAIHVIDVSDSPPSNFAQDNVYFYPSVDVSLRESVSQTFKSILARSPHIHGLVNCAGISPSIATIPEPDATFDRVMAVNCRGTWTLGTEFLRHIQTIHKDGLPTYSTSMVIIGSSASMRGYRSLAAYTCSKHAVLGLARAWALEYAQMGVRVNLVAPGSTMTPMFQAQLANSGLRNESTLQAVAQIPMARWAEPSEIASMIGFLLSDAASYITGQAIPVNGGEF
ncbi:hypothetical protein BDV12DRAFT_190335 [Aspergillus spectabilis]